MKAAEVLDALRRHHSGCALVAELCITDPWAVTTVDTGQAEPLHRRIDALMFDSLQLTAIEIKVSIADVRRDTWAKVWPWARATHRFVYAVPAGLIDDAPFYGAGLWWVHPDGRVEIRRKARIQKYPEPLPQHVVQAIAYRAANGLKAPSEVRS